MTAAPILDLPRLDVEERRQHARTLPHIFAQLDLCTTCHEIREDCAGHDDAEPAADWCDEHAMPAIACSCSARYTAPTLDLAAVLMAPPQPEEWVLWPFVERGQQAAFVSTAKAGKSLIMFELAIAASSGKSYLGRPAAAPIKVMYLDRENTAKDLRSRMISFGTQPGDLANIEYISFPDMDELTTKRGGGQLLDLVDQHAPDLVVIDTVSRFIDGPENDADTWLALYRNSLVALKARGVAVIRLDHTGKDEDRGARGSSAKSSDVDAEWTLVHDRVKDERILKRIRSRGSNGPDRLVLSVERGPLRHEVVGDRLKDVDNPSALAGLLKKYGAHETVGRKRAAEILAENGHQSGRDFSDRQLRAALPIFKGELPGDEQDKIDGI